MTEKDIPEAPAELVEGQPNQPAEAPAELPEGAELEAMVAAEELGVAELATEEDAEAPEEGAELTGEPEKPKRETRKSKAEAKAKAKAEAKAEAEAEAEAEKETSPLEPDESPDEKADLTIPEGDLPGIVTKLSKDLFKKLTSAWISSGRPTRLSAFGSQWVVVDDGAKFVSKGSPGPMGDYGSLSTGYAKG